MRKETIASVKRRLKKAAKELHDEHLPAYPKVLSRMANIPPTSLRHMLTFVAPEWRAELELVDGKTENWNRTIVYAFYENAAKVMLKDDRLPTELGLAKLLQVTRDAVRKFMKQHSELARRINYSSQTDSEVYRAGKILRRFRKRVTVSAIARKCGYRRETVSSVLKRRPDFIDQLSVRKPRKQHKSRQKKKSVLMMLLDTTRTLPRTPFPAFVVLEDRIVTTVARRYGLQYEQLMGHASRGNARIGAVRGIVMYLLESEANLTFEQIGRFLSNRRQREVKKGLDIVRKQIAHSHVQQELQVLRGHLFANEAERAAVARLFLFLQAFILLKIALVFFK